LSQLAVTGCPPWSDLTRKWAESLQAVILRHPSRDSVPCMDIIDGPIPTLCLYLDKTRDSTDWSKVMENFVISNVALAYHPGHELARQWLAAAWYGYVGHESLELCTVGDLKTRPLDPHEPPHYFDRSLRVGLPVELTPATLRATLCLVMEPPIADGLIARAEEGVG
jgi:hypothetical protein